MDRTFFLDVAPFLILFLPLGGFVVLCLFGPAIRRDKEQKGAGVLACVTVGIAFLLAVGTALQVRGLAGDVVNLQSKLEAAHIAPRDIPYLPYQPLLYGGGRFINVGPWISVGPLDIVFGLLLDSLSSVMMLVVTGVGFLIHVYSLGYMEHDEDRVRFFSYLNLFTFFMLVLVMGGSLPLMFVGWEGVGLCSYLLIGFWFKKKSATDAGMKAFIVNRVGDVGLILGTIIAFNVLGTVSLMDLAEHASALPVESDHVGVVTVICLLLFVGACGKSAQIPLHVWLPDAMEGPTPVSALIHAATMVTAGVYMVARLGPLFRQAPWAMTAVAVVGTATALMAATIALVQTDIKKVLAYSTVSQLGYMFLACGVGAFGYAVFHLFTHAFFKALLFLGSGSVIHALSGEQDLRKMGGLARKIPWTFGTFVVGTVAIAGIPPFAGFFSKDGILGAALAEGHPILFAVALLTAVLTAFYMARLLFLTFSGSFRGGHEAEHHIHESPWTMLVPLIVLAVGSTVGGFVGIPAFVNPAFRVAGEEAHEAAWLPWVAGLLAAAAIAAAHDLYVRRREVQARLAETLLPLRRVLEAKYFFDNAYYWFVDHVVVSGSEALLWKNVDAGFIDGLVNGAARVVDEISRGARGLQSGLVRVYAVVILGGAVGLIAWVLW